MKHGRWQWLGALWMLAMAGCSDPAPTPVDAATTVDQPSVQDVQTAETAVDAGPADTGAVDVGVDVGIDAGMADVGVDAGAMDVGAADGTVGDAGTQLGTISGMCGTLRGMLRATTPSLVRNAMTFRAGERYERAAFTGDSLRLWDTPNAGGSSAESEMMSFELLRRCEGATLVATETEVMYQPPDDSGANSITDILVGIGGDRVGVSVTRMYRPRPMVLTDENVRSLLEDKLRGINRSSQRVLPAHRWVKQILSVWAVDEAAAAAVERVWPTLDATLRADTIVLLTVSSGGGFIYCNPDPPLGTECPALN